MLKKKEVFTINEFLIYLERKELHELEEKARIINRNVAIKKTVIFTIATLMNLSTYAIASNDPFYNIGSKFWFYIKSFGRWACLIMCALEVIRALNNGETRNIAKVLFKYLIAYATFSVLPWFYDEIDSAFSILP